MKEDLIEVVQGDTLNVKIYIYDDTGEVPIGTDGVTIYFTCRRLCYQTTLTYDSGEGAWVLAVDPDITVGWYPGYHTYDLTMCNADEVRTTVYNGELQVYKKDNPIGAGDICEG